MDRLPILKKLVRQFFCICDICSDCLYVSNNIISEENFKTHIWKDCIIDICGEDESVKQCVICDLEIRKYNWCYRRICGTNNWICRGKTCI